MSDPMAVPSSPLIVLVRPQKGENIGAAARIMRNFGLQRLRLVAPACLPTASPARAMAAGAVAVLEEAELFSTLGEALADCRFALAITARRRDMAMAAHTMAEAAELPAFPAAYVFGPERTGLSNEEAALADALLHIPVDPSFSSLNLAQAVAVVCWNWFAGQKHAHPPVEQGEGEPAPKEQLIDLFEHLESALDAADFFRPLEKRSAMILTLRAALQRAGFTEREIRALRGVVAALEKTR